MFKVFEQTPGLFGTGPVLTAPDVASAVAFYHERLGFSESNADAETGAL